MNRQTIKHEKLSLPAIALRNIITFPSVNLIFEVSRQCSISSCEKAVSGDEMVFLVLQKDAFKKLERKNLYKTGVVAKIKQYITLPDGNGRVFAEPVCRADLIRADISETEFNAEIICKVIKTEDNGGIEGEALLNEAKDAIKNAASLSPKISKELINSLSGITDIGAFADLAASNIFAGIEDKQAILNEYDPLERLRLFVTLLREEEEILSTEAEIHDKVKQSIADNQREYYLKEQLKVLQNELGTDDADSECGEYLNQIYAKHLPQNVEEKLVKEVKKLEKNPYNSAEAAVIRNYIETVLELPWQKKTRDRVDVDTAEKILNRDHNGLEKVKERILEYLAVKQLNSELKNQIICLVGPPGTGKTSIAASIATAMNRKFVRVSLGGIRDEADIRGHRKTYIASMPGRIMNGMVEAGVKNPLMLLDEVDKLTSDAHGDPASALLEVLDAEQNSHFRDHFIELPFDLSECVFIATANTLDTIPRPLIDRMEIIELSIYTRHEKCAIARDHLIPKQLKKHGLTSKLLKITDDAIYEIIDYYTREAGVRNLEREIGSVCRKVARIFVKEGKKSRRVDAKDIQALLGPRKIIPEDIEQADEIGVVNGLAYTAVGGDLLKIEALTMPGTGKLELTGSLGDVMKESAKAALSYIRANADKYSIDKDFYKNLDIHIHVPEGAVPKDGPSAGVTMTTALISALSSKSVRHDVAMTGEVTLRGKVLPIGGLKEKTMAAYQNKMTTVLIPKNNAKDLDEIDPTVRQNLNFVLCSTVDDVISNSILQ